MDSIIPAKKNAGDPAAYPLKSPVPLPDIPDFL